MKQPGGFTLLMVLFGLVLIGLGLALAGQQWSFIMRREKEAELLFRGDEIRDAIEAYRTATGGVTTFPRKLEDLVKDPRTSFTRRYLRKVYTDPITGGDWELIKEGDFIRGVRSRSGGEPIKTNCFPPEYAVFAGATSYRDWKFEVPPLAAALLRQPAGQQAPQQVTPPTASC